MEELKQELAERWAALTRQAGDLQRQIDERRDQLNATLGAAQELERVMESLGMDAEEMEGLLGGGEPSSQPFPRMGEEGEDAG